MSDAPLVSILVLNYNGRHFLDECFDSLDAQTFQDFEVIVVDNGSTDGSVPYLQERCTGRWQLILNANNVGFAEGNNQALRQSRGRFVVFLNNDTRVDSDWLAELVAAAEAHPEAGMFACQIRSYDAPETMDTSGIIVYRDGMSRGQGRLEPAERYATPMEMFAPSCCAALYRREVLDLVGGFDREFFAYCEDLDLGMRARLAGYTCWFVPTARVYHHYSGTGGKYSPLKAFLVERNHLWILIKLFPKRMILLSPWHTFVRYALQAYGVLTGRGASGKFAGSLPAYHLLLVLIRAYWAALLALPRLLRERGEVRAYAKASRKEIETWFRRFGISAVELCLKD
ncbi:MAG TPA: glycosyltransferase family 2 protein [Oscillatoriaceae cyanobacterium]